MKSIKISEVKKYVEDNIGSFHLKRLQNLEKLKLSQILKRKNPYLFKAKNILTAQDLVKNFLTPTYLPKKKPYLVISLKDLQFSLTVEFTVVKNLQQKE